MTASSDYCNVTFLSEHCNSVGSQLRFTRVSSTYLLNDFFVVHLKVIYVGGSVICINLSSTKHSSPLLCSTLFDIS